MSDVPNYSRPFSPTNGSFKSGPPLQANHLLRPGDQPQFGKKADAELAEIRKEQAKDLLKETRWDVREKLTDAAFAVADIIALLLNGHAYTGTQGSYALATGGMAAHGAVALRDNPWFVANGHDKRESPVTAHYLRNRARMTFGGALASFAGNLLEFTGSPVNPTGTLQHVNSVYSTGRHLYAIRAIGQSYKSTATITRWCDTIIRMKGLKLGTRAVQIASDVIPLPLADKVVNVIAVAMTYGYRLGLTELCYLTAIEIHWRAFREQTIARSGHTRVADIKADGEGSGTDAGPASRIFAEILTRHGATRIWGQHDAASLILEPAGWMALGDKLVLA
jgi:hypothetical protein